ncbi:MAG: hypothetical protein WAW31_07110 [Smithella sp.]
MTNEAKPILEDIISNFAPDKFIGSSAPKAGNLKNSKKIWPITMTTILPKARSWVKSNLTAAMRWLSAPLPRKSR